MLLGRRKRRAAGREGILQTRRPTSEDDHDVTEKPETGMRTEDRTKKNQLAETKRAKHALLQDSLARLAGSF